MKVNDKTSFDECALTYEIVKKLRRCGSRKRERVLHNLFHSGLITAAQLSFIKEELG